MNSILFRPVLCLAILLFATTVVIAQSQLSNLKQAKIHILEPKPIEGGEKTLPFKKVVVIDNRTDTSKLGYMMDSRFYRKLHTQGSLVETVEKLIGDVPKKVEDTANVGTLYIFIKHLWLQQTSGRELSKQKLSHGFVNDDSLFATCKATLECYVQQDSLFYPLYRLDSNLLIRGLLRKKVDQLVTLPFQVALDKIVRLDLSKKRKPMTWQQAQAYSSHKTYPSLSANTLARGVYLTFQDFLNQRITYSDIEVRWGDVTDELYIKNGDKSEILQTFWGFSDAGKLYVKLGFSFFELSKENNTYELLGAKGLIHTAYSGQYRIGSSPLPVELVTAGMMLASKKSSMHTTLVKPLQLNMETGEPY